jgi:hypothetical protein
MQTPEAIATAIESAAPPIVTARHVDRLVVLRDERDKNACVRKSVLTCGYSLARFEIVQDAYAAIAFAGTEPRPANRRSRHVKN